MKPIILLIPFTLMLFSCEIKKDKGEKIYSQGFSATELLFEAEGGDAIITSQREEWRISEYIIINEEYYYNLRCKEVFPDNNSGGVDRKPGVCSDGFLTIKWDYYLNRFEIIEIKIPWFIITKENTKQLNVFIEPNLTGETRKIVLPINDKIGTNILITQNGE